MIEMGKRIGCLWLLMMLAAACSPNGSEKQPPETGTEESETPPPTEGGETQTGETPAGEADAGEAENPQPDAIRVQHILIGFRDAPGFRGRPIPEGASQRSQQQAKELALALLDRARDGEGFDDLVKKYTDDSPPGIYGLTNEGVPSKPGYRSRSGMVPAFGNVGFELEVGEVGLAPYDPRTSPYGWHIIKRIE